jgi:hypothetical protein
MPTIKPRTKYKPTTKCLQQSQEQSTSLQRNAYNRAQNKVQAYNEIHTTKLRKNYKPSTKCIQSLVQAYNEMPTSKPITKYKPSTKCLQSLEQSKSLQQNAYNKA